MEFRMRSQVQGFPDEIGMRYHLVLHLYIERLPLMSSNCSILRRSYLRTHELAVQARLPYCGQGWESGLM